MDADGGVGANLRWEGTSNWFQQMDWAAPMGGSGASHNPRRGTFIRNPKVPINLVPFFPSFARQEDQVALFSRTI